MCCGKRVDGTIGKSLVGLPWYIVERIEKAIDAAEGRLGRPPGACDIFIMCEELGYNDNFMPGIDVYKVAAILCSLLREHLVFTDRTMSTWTTGKREGYYSYNDFFNMHYNGYKLAKDQTIMPDTAKTINFDKLWHMLRSKDKQLLTDMEWMFD